MAIKIEWKPVLQKLALKDYHQDYGSEAIMVCVNPKPELWSEREKLRTEYTQRALDVEKARIKATGSKTDEDLQESDRLNSEFEAWIQQTFLPGIRDWFARVWSLGGDSWSADDVLQIEQTDEHLATWLKFRTIDMIEEHRTARKKA